MNRPTDTPPIAQSFIPADQRLGLTQARFPGFDLENVTLARLVNFAAKGLLNNANQTLKPWQLNYTSYAVLVMLYGSPEYALSPSELVAATHEKSTNITRITDALVARGLIEREIDLGDRRKVVVRMTAEGIALLETVLPAMMQVTLASFAALDDGERQQLNTLLRKVIAGQEQLK